MGVLIEREIYLPRCETAAAYTVDAVRTLEPGGPGWRGVLDAATHAIAHLASRGHDAVAMVAVLDALPGADAHLVLLIGCADAFAHEELDALSEAIAHTDLPWRAEGFRRVPDGAVPIVAHAEGSAWHLWHVQDGQTMVRFFGVDVDRDVVVHSEPAAGTDPSVFPAALGHALAVPAPETEPDADAPSLIELMKVAWTMDLAERIVEADGYAHDDELEILKRTFAPRRLRALGLVDRASCVRLRCLARVELATLIDPDEKRALLGLLFRIAEADRAVVPAELEVLRVAAGELGVPWEEAQASMLAQW